MSNRSLLEINHDCSHKIEHEPMRFVELLSRYTASASHENAENLENEFGVRVFGMRHHSEGFYIRWGRFAKKIIEGDSNN